MWLQFWSSNDWITSLPCTSIVTKAPNVSRSSSLRSVRTKTTIYFNYSTSSATNYLIIPFVIAYSAFCVHRIMFTAKTVCAGHFLTQSTLLDSSSIDVLVIFFNVSIMTPSISESHFSTLPFFYPSFTSTLFEKSTASFSIEIIPETIPLAILSCPIPSKHLLICLCTVSGSLVWARISSSS
jgi:hypothetical protein